MINLGRKWSGNDDDDDGDDDDDDDADDDDDEDDDDDDGDDDDDDDDDVDDDDIKLYIIIIYKYVPCFISLSGHHAWQRSHLTAAVFALLGVWMRLCSICQVETPFKKGREDSLLLKLTRLSLPSLYYIF